MKAMNCRYCIHNGECNGQPFCGGVWYAADDSTYRPADEEEEQEAEDGK